jgi:hypothetical protein
MLLDLVTVKKRMTDCSRAVSESKLTGRGLGVGTPYMYSVLRIVDTSVETTPYRKV